MHSEASATRTSERLLRPGSRPTFNGTPGSFDCLPTMCRAQHLKARQVGFNRARRIAAIRSSCIVTQLRFSVRHQGRICPALALMPRDHLKRRRENRVFPCDPVRRSRLDDDVRNNTLILRPSRRSEREARCVIDRKTKVRRHSFIHFACSVNGLGRLLTDHCRERVVARGRRARHPGGERPLRNEQVDGAGVSAGPPARVNQSDVVVINVPCEACHARSPYVAM